MNVQMECIYSQNFDEQNNNEIELTIPNLFGKTNHSLSSYNYGFVYHESIGSDINKVASWDKLSNIRDISICQVAMHFSSPITTNDLQNILLAIDANSKYTWAVIDTGPISLKPKFDSNENWGFPMNIELNGESNSIKDGTVNQAANDFQKEMIFLESKSKYLGKKELNEELKHVNNYLQDNGIKIKGVIVVGLTKDILTYKDSDLISKIDVIKAELDYKLEY